jgi:AcrR family transcriptional regulator
LSSDTVSAAPTPRLRADAQRNRDRLLGAARDAFSVGAGQDDAVSLESIARGAGVGIGTLYRNFPTREALVAAVYAVELDEVVAAADPFLDGRPANDALRAWMDRYVSFVVTKHGMADALQVPLSSETTRVPDTRARITGTVARFVTVGRADGTIRADVEPDDVTASMVGALLATRASRDTEQLRRVLDIIVTGIRTGA